MKKLVVILLSFSAAAFAQTPLKTDTVDNIGADMDSTPASVADHVVNAGQLSGFKDDGTPITDPDDLLSLVTEDLFVGGEVDAGSIVVGDYNITGRTIPKENVSASGWYRVAQMSGYGVATMRFYGTANNRYDFVTVDVVAGAYPNSATGNSMIVRENSCYNTGAVRKIRMSTEGGWVYVDLYLSGIIKDFEIVVASMNQNKRWALPVDPEYNPSVGSGDHIEINLDNNFSMQMVNSEGAPSILAQNSIQADEFIGSGAGLTDIKASAISAASGKISADVLPASGTWNAGELTINAKSISGKGEGLTDVNAAEIGGMDVDDVQQSAGDYYYEQVVEDGVVSLKPTLPKTGLVQWLDKVENGMWSDRAEQSVECSYLSFDGHNDRVETPVKLSPEGFTFVMWTTIRDEGQDHRTERRMVSLANYLTINDEPRQYGDRLQVNLIKVDGAGDWPRLGGSAVNQLGAYVLTYDGTTLKGYRDGVLRWSRDLAPITARELWFSPNAKHNLYRSAGWNKVLTDAQVAALTLEGPLPEGTVFDYQFNEIKEDKVVDASGNGNDATMYNFETSALNQNGAKFVESSCATFDGNYITTDKIPHLGDQDFELEVRFFGAPTTSGSSLVGNWTSQAPNNWRIYIFPDGRPLFQTSYGQILGDGNYNDGKWHTAKVIRKGSQLTFSVDGNVFPPAAWGGAVFQDQPTCYIGARLHRNGDMMEQFKGQMAYVKLTCAENGFHYVFSEGAGSTVYDVSGNGNHGTIVGSSLWANTQNEFHYNMEEGFSEGTVFSLPQNDRDGSGGNQGIASAASITSRKLHLTGWYKHVGPAESEGSVMILQAFGNGYNQSGFRIETTTTGHYVSFGGSGSHLGTARPLTTTWADNEWRYVDIRIDDTDITVMDKNGAPKTTSFDWIVNGSGIYFGGGYSGTQGRETLYRDWKLTDLETGEVYFDLPMVNGDCSDRSGNNRYVGSSNATFQPWEELRVPALADGSGEDALGNPLTNPAGNWHNGAETKIKQSAYNTALKAADVDHFWYDTAGAPKAVDYATLEANYNDYVFSDIADDKKLNVLTYAAPLAGDALAKVQQNLPTLDESKPTVMQNDAGFVFEGGAFQVMALESRK